MSQLTPADRALTDPRFLVTADPAEVLTLLPSAAAPEARVAAAVYRVSAGVHGSADPAARRQLLALDAARFGQHRLSDRLAAVALPAAPAAWRVVWATSTAAHPALVATDAPDLPPSRPAPAETAATTVDGRPRTLRCDPVSGLRLDEEPLPGLAPDTVLPLTVEGRPHALAADEKRAALWDLTSHQLASEYLPFGDDDLTGWAVTELDGQPHLLAGSFGGTLALFRLPGGKLRASARSEYRELRLLVPFALHGRPHALVAGCDPYVGERLERAELWSLAPLRPVDHLLIDTSAVLPVAVDGRELLRTGGGQLWDFAELPPVQRLLGHREAVRALAVTTLDGRPVVLSGGDDQSLRLRDLATGALLGSPLATVHPSGDWTGIVSLTCIEADGRPYAVTGHTDSYLNTSVRTWDLTTRTEAPLTELPPGEDDFTPVDEDPPITATDLLHGRSALVAATGSRVQIHPADAPDLALAQLAFPARVTALALTPSGRLLVAFGPDLALLDPR
ncbi:WD40 repeat domain-containing protein [Kitasatospora cheerisanensis]|nr:hypothetical protein [Kitasatospora cheerisanensis]